MTTQLTQIQKDIIFGSLLGDGNLQTFSNGKTWRYRAVHSEKYAEYINYKYTNLANLCDTGILTTGVDKTRPNASRKMYFNTKVHKCLKVYGDMFYTFDQNTGKFVKDVPIDVENHLTPHALAVFYQDDGALKDAKKTKAMRICTESFTKAGVERIVQALKNKYQIEATLAPKYSSSKTVSNTGATSKPIVGYRIYIPAKSAKAFADLIREHMVNCMTYKLNC